MPGVFEYDGILEGDGVHHEVLKYCFPFGHHLEVELDYLVVQPVQAYEKQSGFSSR